MGNEQAKMLTRDYWEDRYRADETPWHTGRPCPELVRTVVEDHIGPCKAFDIGCGVGTNARWLAEQGFDVTGIDISVGAIQRAKSNSNCDSIRVRFISGDFLEALEVG